MFWCMTIIINCCVLIFPTPPSFAKESFSLFPWSIVNFSDGWQMTFQFFFLVNKVLLHCSDIFLVDKCHSVCENNSSWASKKSK